VAEWLQPAADISEGNGWLAKFGSSHPVYPHADHDLRVFAVADIAPEGAGAVLPVNRITGIPCRAYASRDRANIPLVALACLAGLATGQPGSTGH
jgi:hypothetical protein